MPFIEIQYIIGSEVSDLADKLLGKIATLAAPILKVSPDHVKVILKPVSKAQQRNFKPLSILFRIAEKPDRIDKEQELHDALVEAITQITPEELKGVGLIYTNLVMLPMCHGEI